MVVKLPLQLSADLAVGRWPYRKAFAARTFLRFEESSVPEIEDFHQRLAKRFGKQPDNHTTYSFIANDNGDVLYVTFSDGKVFVGTDIRFDIGEPNPEPQEPISQ